MSEGSGAVVAETPRAKSYFVHALLMSVSDANGEVWNGWKTYHC